MVSIWLILTIQQGCTTQEVGDPSTNTRVTVGELRIGSTYFFRLVARSPRGTTPGASTPAITTLGTFLPSREVF